MKRQVCFPLGSLEKSKGGKESQCLYGNLGGINPRVLFTDIMPSLGCREENVFFIPQVLTGSPNPGQSTRLVFLELGVILMTKIFMNDPPNPPPSNPIPGKSTSIFASILSRLVGCRFILMTVYFAVRKIVWLIYCCCSVAKSCPTLGDPMDCSTPGTPVSVWSNSCPLSRRCYLTISSSVIPSSFCLQSVPASGSFIMNWLFASGS